MRSTLMWDDHPLFLRLGYIVMAALAGAITALAFTRWKELSRAEIILTLVAGFSFAVFVTPWVAHQFFGVDDRNLRAIAALTYIFGSGWNIVLPKVIRWTGQQFGETEETKP
jgi:hypothetical protein